MQRQESNFSEDVKAYQPQTTKRKQTWNTSNAADAHAEVMAEYLAESVSPHRRLRLRSRCCASRSCTDARTRLLFHRYPSPGRFTTSEPTLSL
jgi:hypothetical protein